MTKDRENGARYDDYEGTSLLFTYSVNSGSLIRRSYAADLPEGLWRKIAESEEYRYSDLICTDYTLGYQYTYDDTTYAEKFKKLDEIEPVAVRLSSVAVRENDRYGNRRDSLVIDGLDYSELRAALFADLRNDTAFGRREELPLGTLEIGSMEEYDGRKTFVSRSFTFRYTIYESYTNTARF